MTHHIGGKQRYSKVTLTVDSDGDALGEDEAVGTLEGGDLAELVELLVLGGDALGWLSVNRLDVESVLLCDSQKTCGARVALCRKSQLHLSVSQSGGEAARQLTA